MKVWFSFPPEGQIQANLVQIGHKNYYDQSKDKYYQLTQLPKLIALKDNSLIQRMILSLTEHDPYFVLLNYLENPKQQKIQSLPFYLKKSLHNNKIDLTCLAQVNIQNDTFIRNMEKITYFLKRKAQILSQGIKQFELQGSMIKLIYKDEKKEIQITKSAIETLKNSVSQYFFDTLDKFDIAVNRVNLPSYQQEDYNAFKKNPAKSKAINAKRKAEANAMMKKQTQSQHKGGGLMGFLSKSKKIQNEQQDT